MEVGALRCSNSIEGFLEETPRKNAGMSISNCFRPLTPVQPRAAKAWNGSINLDSADHRASVSD